MPADLNLPAIVADKTLRAQLLPRCERLRALNTKLGHSVLLLGSEYYAEPGSALENEGFTRSELDCKRWSQ